MSTNRLAGRSKQPLDLKQALHAAFRVFTERDLGFQSLDSDAAQGAVGIVAGQMRRGVIVAKIAISTSNMTPHEYETRVSYHLP